MRNGKKTILVLITHTLSEINVLFPLFAELKKNGNFEINVIFTVRKIYNQYKEVPFYIYCEDHMDLTIDFCHLPNKFNKILENLNSLPFGNIVRLIISFFWLLFKLPYLFNKLVLSNIFMHEISNQISSTRILYLFQTILGKSIYTYHHGNEISIDKTAACERAWAKKSTMLLFHLHNSKYMKELGYVRQNVIGYPPFFTEWIELINNYSSETISQNPIVLIYSRHINERYMDPEKYVVLMSSTLRVVRIKFGNIPIVIKPHPREEIRVIEDILKCQEISNVTISYEHPAVLAKNAKIAITFWGSVILESLSMGVPTVEYYIEARKFREDYPNGSNYKAVGIHSVSDEQGLEAFIDTILNESYEFPQILEEFKNGKNTQIFSH